MIVTLTLNAAIDKAYRISGTVQPGTVMRVLSCINTAGGKGLNVARVVHCCGEEVTPSGLVGGNTGSLLEELAAGDGLKGRFVRIKGETRCCINILDENLQSTEFLEPGEDVTEAEIDSFIKEFLEICKDAQVITMSGSVPRGVRKGIYKELTEQLKAMGKTVILDTSGELLKEGIKAAPHMIKPNQEELEMLLGKPIISMEQTIEAAKELHKGGIAKVVVSLGKDGALLVSDQGIFHGVPPKITAINTVGCGDSMVAGFAVAMQRGLSAQESLKYAVSVSAANAMSHRTGHFEKEEFDKIYPQVTLRELE